MKIIIIGGSGTIGQAVVKELSARHTIISVGRKHGEVNVDIQDKNSIITMYEKIGKIDAVIAVTGKVHFGALHEMQDEHYQIGLQNKLMGQVNLVLLGIPYMNQGGSFTLTSGILANDPIRYGSSAAMVNGALESFVISAAIEMPNNLRINAVSPTVITESMKDYADYFRGFVSVSSAKVALAYSKSVEGAQTGQIYKVQ